MGRTRPYPACLCGGRTGQLIGFINGGGFWYLWLDSHVRDTGRFGRIPGAAILWTEGGFRGRRDERSWLYKISTRRTESGRIWGKAQELGGGYTWLSSTCLNRSLPRLIAGLDVLLSNTPSCHRIGASGRALGRERGKWYCAQ